MTLKPTNRLIGSDSDKRGRAPSKRRHKLSRRGKSSALLVKAYDNIELAIGGRDSVVETLAAADLTDDQHYLFAMIADPRNDKKPLAELCNKAGFTLGAFLRLFKDQKLARAQIEAISRAVDDVPQVAEDAVRLAKVTTEPCGACKGTGERDKTITGEDGAVTTKKVSCVGCNGTGTSTYVPTVERQKLALEIAGLYNRRSAGVQIANVFQPPAPANDLGGRITQDYLKDMRAGTDRLLYPGRERANVDPSETVDTGEAIEAMEVVDTVEAVDTVDTVEDVVDAEIVPGQRTAPKSEDSENAPLDERVLGRVGRSTGSTGQRGLDRAVDSAHSMPFLPPAGGVKEKK